MRSARRPKRCWRRTPIPRIGDLAERLDADPPRARFADDPHAALRVIDAWGWMHGLSADLSRAERAAAVPKGS